MENLKMQVKVFCNELGLDEAKMDYNRNSHIIADYMDYDKMVFLMVEEPTLEVGYAQSMFVNLYKQMEQCWDSKDYEKYMECLHRRFYRYVLPKFYKMYKKSLISKELYWSLFSEMIKDASGLMQELDKTFIRNSFKTNPYLSEQLAQLESFVVEGKLTIYRGETIYSSTHKDKGVMWTLDKSRAFYYASTFGLNGDVYKCEIPLSMVLGYFEDYSDVVFEFSKFKHLVSVTWLGN